MSGNWHSSTCQHVFHSRKVSNNNSDTRIQFKQWDKFPSYINTSSFWNLQFGIMKLYKCVHTATQTLNRSSCMFASIWLLLMSEMIFINMFFQQITMECALTLLSHSSLLALRSKKKMIFIDICFQHMWQELKN